MSPAKKTHPQSALRPAIGDFMRLSQATPDHPLPIVELLHTMPDGTVHVDWMIAQDPEATLPLITFRLRRPLTELKSGEKLIAERIADHRPAFLDYEGTIDGGRGAVRRLSRGRICQWDEITGGWEIMILSQSEAGDAVSVRLRLESLPDEQCLIMRLGPDSQPLDTEA